MTTDVYQRLRKHLDDLPGGYPATDTGVELRILKRLFTPEEAWLATYLTLIPEEPGVVARRAKIGKEEAAKRLEEMARKGLLFRIEEVPGKPAYVAAQFMFGIWEFHVKDLSPEFVADVNEYKPYLRNSMWAQPQLRTIPVGQSIQNELNVLTYERAEELIEGHDRFSIAPCICRKEKKMMGDECDRPEDTCLGFGIGADYAIRNGFGRACDKKEILDALQAANDHALVLQPANSQEITYMCACCGCCCDILSFLKEASRPSALVSTPFVVEADGAKCEGCKTCVDRCQMDALSMVEEKVLLDADRCIGCGLCVTTCPSGALTLKRKPDTEQWKVPKNIEEAYISHGQVRGKLGVSELLKLQIKSKWDRLLSAR